MGPMGWPPRASIECTGRMLVFMGLASLVVGCQQKLDFSPLLQWSGEKLGTDPQITQPS
jgi:hypothetical protein